VMGGKAADRHKPLPRPSNPLPPPPAASAGASSSAAAPSAALPAPPPTSDTAASGPSPRSSGPLPPLPQQPTAHVWPFPHLQVLQQAPPVQLFSQPLPVALHHHDDDDNDDDKEGGSARALSSSPPAKKPLPDLPPAPAPSRPPPVPARPSKPESAPSSGTRLLPCYTGAHNQPSNQRSSPRAMNGVRACVRVWHQTRSLFLPVRRRPPFLRALCPVLSPRAAPAARTPCECNGAMVVP
jgi:hypothetical protein